MAPKEGAPKRGGESKNNAICITKNMQGHSLEILPSAPETIDPFLLVIVGIIDYSAADCRMTAALNVERMHMNYVDLSTAAGCDNDHYFVVRGEGHMHLTSFREFQNL